MKLHFYTFALDVYVRFLPARPFITQKKEDIIHHNATETLEYISKSPKNCTDQFIRLCSPQPSLKGTIYKKSIVMKPDMSAKASEMAAILRSVNQTLFELWILKNQLYKSWF